MIVLWMMFLMTMHSVRIEKKRVMNATMTTDVLYLVLEKIGDFRIIKISNIINDCIVVGSPSCPTKKLDKKLFFARILS